MMISSYAHGCRITLWPSSRRLVHAGPSLWNSYQPQQVSTSTTTPTEIFINEAKPLKLQIEQVQSADPIFVKQQTYPQTSEQILLELLTKNKYTPAVLSYGGVNDGGVVLDKMNATGTLPQFQMLLVKNKVQELLETELLKSSKSMSSLQKRWIVNYRFFKNYLNFFKFGITNIWKNYRGLTKSVYGSGGSGTFIYNNSLNVSERVFEIKKIPVKRRGFDAVVDELANVIRLTENEHHVKNTNMWVQTQQTKPEELINLTRSEFQRMIRDKENFIKLPLFGLLFSLFEEVTILICLIFPSITPNTCVFPKLMPYVFDKSLNAQLKLQLLVRYGVSQKDIMLKNPFVMEYGELDSLCDLLNVNKGIAATDSKLRELLLRRYKEILIDNYLILRDGGVYGLNVLELFDCCIRRGLIDFEELMKGVHSGKDGEFLQMDVVNEDKMRRDLIEFILDFSKRENSVGMLGGKVSLL